MVMVDSFQPFGIEKPTSAFSSVAPVSKAQTYADTSLVPESYASPQEAGLRALFLNAPAPIQNICFPACLTASPSSEASPAAVRAIVASVALPSSIVVEWKVAQVALVEPKSRVLSPSGT